jgi:OOP family OmpA-OmpF porin
MYYRLTRIILLFIAITSSGQLVAQSQDTASRQKIYISNSEFRTWSVGVSVGVSTPYTLVGYNSRQDFTSPDIQVGYALYIKNQLTNAFGLQADLMMGKLKGDHSNERTPDGDFVFQQFNTKLNWSASISGNLTIFHCGIVQPYFNGGGGILSYSPSMYTRHSNITAPVFGTLSSFFVPIGLGLKVNLTRGINLDIGYNVNFVMADNLDAYNYGPTNDRFSYSHIGLEFAIGKRTKKQLAAQPVAIPVQNRAMAREQALKDELQSQQDQLAAEKQKNAQLSSDLDSVNAKVAGLTNDSDGDGVPDLYDKCPNTQQNTKVDASGCPVPATTVAAADFKPEITDEDRRNVATTASTIEFYSGTEIISGRAFPNLNTLVSLLVDKKVALKIDVYTNKSADSDSDKRLAKLRAEAVKNYLVNRGVDSSKIETASHSGFQPTMSAAKRRKLTNGGLVALTLKQ